MLTCEQMTALVTEYVEGRLPFTERAKFQVHILMCKHCREYLAQMKLAARTLGRMPEAPVPDEVMQELLARFRTWPI